MRVLVIGGSGFIGPFVVSELRDRGHEVVVFSRHPMSAAGAAHIAGDRRALAASIDRLRAWSPDVVVDLILSSGAQAREAVALLRGLVSRVVAASSIDVYRACSVMHRLEDGPPDPVPLTEASPLRSQVRAYPPQQIKMLQSVFTWLDDDYDKIPVEQEILGAEGFRNTVLRLPMIYGPGDRLHRLAPMLAHMDAGTTDYVIAESIANWRAPRGYVANVGHAIALAAVDDRAAGRVYNVAEPENFSEREWAERVASAIGWRGRIVVVPDRDAPPNPLLAANLAQDWAADSTRIRQELGYAEIVSVEDAIRRTIAWQRDVSATRN